MPRRKRPLSEPTVALVDKVRDHVHSVWLELSGMDDKKDSILQMIKVLPVYNLDWQVEVRCAPAVFQRFAVSSELTVISQWGISRVFDSAVALAQGLLVRLEELLPSYRLQLRQAIVCIGNIDATKQACPYCPLLLASTQALWWHVQVQHQQPHHVAKECVTSNAQALVVYTGGITVKEKEQPVSKKLVTQQQVDPFQLVKDCNMQALDAYCSQHPNWNPATAQDKHGAGLIHWAAGQASSKCVQHLVDQYRCNPHAPQAGHRSFGGRTPLHWAARNGRVETVEYLLQCHVNLLAETQDGTTAWHWAAWQAHADVLRILYEHANDKSRLVAHVNQYGCNAALWAAQGKGTVDTLLLLQQYRCPLDAINHVGHGVLHKAAQRGLWGICEWFEGTDWRLWGPDQEGCMPSDLAGMAGHEELAQYLAEKEESLSLRHGMDSKELAKAPVASKDRVWEPWGGLARVRYACNL